MCVWSFNTWWSFKHLVYISDFLSIMKSTNWSNTYNPRNGPRVGQNLLRSSSLSNIPGLRSASNLPARGGPESLTNQLEVRQERQEIREYLDRLRQLVPACPKAGKLSRLTVIQHVIDYIVELQDTLLHHPVNTILTTDDLHQEQHQEGSEEGPGGGGGGLELAPIHYANPLDADALYALQRLGNSNPNKHSTTQAAPNTRNKTRNSSSNSTNSHKNSTSNSRKNNSSCRRPLGVLSSLKNHRHQ